jgi:hypothetical protein
VSNDKRISRITVGQLRRSIREEFKRLCEARDCWGGSQPEETYDQLLVDDPVYAERSVYVPDDIKDAIKKWMVAMGLDGRKRSR